MSWLNDWLVSSSSGDFLVPGDLTVNGDTSTAGDITHTGSSYGFIHDTGLWEDLHFPVQAINPPGAASDPDRDTGTGLLMFDAAATETVVGVGQMPHAWKSESSITFHCHCMSDAATDPRAAATATAADGVCAGGTVYLTSVTGGFTGHANEYLVITVTGTNSQAVVASYQIASIVSDTNVELVSDPTAGGTADDSVTWAIYPDTVAIQFDYAIIAVDGSWDQSTYSSELIHVQLAAHVGGDAVLQESDFATLDMTGFQDEAHIFWKFSRVGDNGNDTYGADMHFAALGLNYRRNTMGSLAEGGEDF